ncbi:MAG TPA: hypothetical protein VF017_23770 [Thermoanaerobaculia bacterium]|nr:hypothetical protein [Thermoanaerobaculia bacterium]
MRLARLAVEVAQALPPGRHEVLTVDLRARASSYLGNAYRVAADLAQAGRYLELGEALAADGSGDPLLAGEIAWLRGSYATEIREFGRAYEHFRASFNHYADAQEDDLAARTLVSVARSMVAGGNDDPAHGVLLLAISLIRKKPEPELLISVAHTMAMSLVQCGHPSEAVPYIQSVQPLYRYVPGELARLRGCWLEGNLLAQVGLHDEARQVLAGVREGFCINLNYYGMALVSLDLSLVLLKQRKWAEVESLARESYAAFAARGLSDRATAALLLFVDAAKQRTLAEELVKRVAGEIRGGQREAWAAELASR